MGCVHGAGMTIERDIFLSVKRKPAKRADLIFKFGSANKAGSYINRMLREGKLEVIDGVLHTVPGASAPIDGRGKNQQSHPKRNHKPKTRTRDRSDGLPSLRMVTELEKCWR